jgi:hypothetical protein
MASPLSDERNAPSVEEPSPTSSNPSSSSSASYFRVDSPSQTLFNHLNPHLPVRPKPSFTEVAGRHGIPVYQGSRPQGKNASSPSNSQPKYIPLSSTISKDLNFEISDNVKAEANKLAEVYINRLERKNNEFLEKRQTEKTLSKSTRSDTNFFMLFNPRIPLGYTPNNIKEFINNLILENKEEGFSCNSVFWAKGVLEFNGTFINDQNLFRFLSLPNITNKLIIL